jgi:protein-disulfide isomerase
MNPKALGSILCLFLTVGAAAQSSSKAEHSDLQDQIKALADQQQQILSTLNDIRQLLTANAPVRPQQPPALTIKDEAFRGATGATVAIIEYADFECPYCRQYEHDVYPQIAKDYIESGKVKYFFRDLPLPMHPRAMGAARAAHCAGEQGKYWEMHDSLFAKQNAIRDVDMPGRAQELGLEAAKFSECLSSNRYIDDISKSAAEAQKLGIGGTPTFFIGKVDPNGDVTNLKMIIGMRPYDAFKSTIEDSLAAKN